MPPLQKITKNTRLSALVAGLVLMAACQWLPRVQVFDDFIIVETRANDTFASLAADYLNDPAKGPLIAEFNGVDAITPGQELIIPLKPFRKGGLRANGYQTIPVLSYHRVSASDKTEAMTVSRTAFESQMRYLKENGYTVISIDDFMDFLDFKIQVPAKSVVLTFDDGWKSIHDVAFPILKKYNFPATIFVYTDLIGTKRAMTWEQVKTLSENGFSIQCHSKTHRDLTKLKKGESFQAYYAVLERELLGSKKIIEAKTGRECRYFAYAYGAHNELVTAMLQKYGYRGAFTVKRGPNPFFTDNFAIHRSMVYGKYDMKRFKKNIGVFEKRKLR